MILPAPIIYNTTSSYFHRFNRRYHIIYLLLISAVIALFGLLPFLYTDISVKAEGITRPVNERTEVKPVVSGIIDTVFYKEGDTIERNSIILRIRDDNSKSKRVVNLFEINQRQSFIHDLKLLTSTSLSPGIILKLISPLYKEQAIKFIHQRHNQEAALAKANKEKEMNNILVKDKVISSKEFFDTRINQQRVESEYKAFVQEQLSIWQKDLAEYNSELSQYQQRSEEISNDAAYYEIKAPVSGVIQGINTRYAGGLIQANETICMVSPGGDLVAECYLSTTDIGMIRLHQSVKFQVDAFNYTYFGVLTGRIVSIDNDFTVINSKLIFKVRCAFDSKQLPLKNGFSGQLKKGLTLQARFIVARRNLWQLLFDKIDDWINPSASS
ncbi:MAG: HlyD family efflux transporter periplasmic adaptor subunit [Bacteroidota bacterium]